MRCWLRDRWPAIGIAALRTQFGLALLLRKQCVALLGFLADLQESEILAVRLFVARHRIQPQRDGLALRGEAGFVVQLGLLPLDLLQVPS